MIISPMPLSILSISFNGFPLHLCSSIHLTDSMLLYIKPISPNFTIVHNSVINVLICTYLETSSSILAE